MPEHCPGCMCDRRKPPQRRPAMHCHGRVPRGSNPHDLCWSTRIVVIDNTDPARERYWCRECFGHVRHGARVTAGMEQLAPLWGEEDDRVSA